MKSAIGKKSSNSERTTKIEVTKKPEPEIRVLKSATCPSLSGKSTLQFSLGRTESNELQLRIVGNSGKGSFRQDWVDVGAIRAALDKAPRDETVTSDCLRPIFKKKVSANMPSFVFAVLLHEGLVKHSVREKRRYERVEPEVFDATVKALMEGRDTSAKTNEKGSKAKGKEVASKKTPGASTKKNK